MKIAVIICEYNPLQKGHVYHIQNTVKKSMCDRLVCIMSGNFVQRGESAVVDKYTRAKWAIQSGADCVIELPPQYVLSTAKYFALGAIKIADKLKCEKLLSFGSEDGTLDNLQKIADFEESDSFKAILDEYMKKGYGYPQSYAMAIDKLCPDLSSAVATPNNILGIEYLKAIKSTKSSLIPMTIKRLGEYKSDSLDKGFASASAIRQLIMQNKIGNINEYVPGQVYDYLKEVSPSLYKTAKDKLFAILKYIANKQTAKSAHGVKEGIENRIYDCLNTSNDYDELLTQLATKRYTNAYLNRTLINIALANNYTAQELQNEDISFVNILAINKNAKDILSLFDCEVITKSFSLPSDCLIAKCDNLYSSIYFSPKYNAMQLVDRKI